MLQTLFHIPSTIAGWPVFGVGILLAVWVVFSAGLLAWTAWRRGGADALGHLPILALVAAIIVWLLPAMCEPQGLPIRSYGMLMLVAVLAGTGLAVYRARQRRLDPELIYALAFWMFVPGIIGARLFYVIEYWQRQYRPVFEHEGFAAGLRSLVNVSQGGLVVYGSLIGAMLGLLIFVYRGKWPLWALLDLIAPSLALGQAIGRIGCLMNGCCFGGVCDYDWAVTFPPDSPPYMAQVERGMMEGLRIGENAADPAVLQWVAPDSAAAKAGLKPGDRIASLDGLAIGNCGDAAYVFRKVFDEHRPLRIEVEGHAAVELPPVNPPPRSLPVHPAQAYSSIDAFLLCLLLLAFDPFARRDGQVFALMLTAHPISRFLLEMIRNDEAAVFGTGLSISQNISLIFLLLAAALWYHIARRPPGRVWFAHRRSGCA